MRLRRAKLTRLSHPGSPLARVDRPPRSAPKPAHGSALVGPPVALSVDVSTPIVAETGRPDHDHLEAVGPGFVASPRTGRDAHRVPLSEFDNLVVELQTILEPLKLAELFPQPQPLEVELGCGDASFLIEYARRNPGKNFIGVERLLGRIQKLDKKGRRAGLLNTRGVRIESAYFLEYLLPAHCDEALHIYFPDPWPKKKHRKHRLINEGFPALARKTLKPGGIVFLRTDDVDYFQQMTEVFAAAREFEPVETPLSLAEITTDFEREFNAQGIPTQRAAYKVLNG